MAEDKKTNYVLDAIPGEPSELPLAIREHIDQWLRRYPPSQKASGVFEALRVVQAENKGYLTVPLMDAVANYLDLPKIWVYEIATFYTMYYLQPMGTHVVNICSNISCLLNGAEKIIEHIKASLGIDINETTADGKFTLKEVECLGACIAAPVCLIGKTYHEKLTPKKMDDILAALRGSHGE